MAAVLAPDTPSELLAASTALPVSPHSTESPEALPRNVPPTLTMPIRTDNRISTYSHSQSRQTSVVFPLFHSSLSYALVRDFAYPPFHPMHYGPVPGAGSGYSTPSSNFDTSRRLSDAPTSYDGSRSMWSAGPWGDTSSDRQSIGQQLPSTSFGNNDPSSDEENAAMNRRVSKHRKSKSYANMDEYARGRRRNSRTRERQPGGRSQAGRTTDSTYRSGTPSQVDENTRPENMASRQMGSLLGVDRTDSPLSAANANQPLDPSIQHPPFREDEAPPTGFSGAGDEHRPGSTSLDESFAGPSLALYEFRPENDNELALKEGQIIQVGYRHGQGWLVAMNIETGEQGLVPEEYVRLLRDIEGWGEDQETEDHDLGADDLDVDQDTDPSGEVFLSQEERSS